MTRELVWDGCVNVRDLGGIPLEEGGETRGGVLVRADNIRKLAAKGRQTLAAHGVVRVVDLRWPEERALDAEHDLAVEVVHVSLLGPRRAPDYEDGLEAYMAADDPAGYWAASYVSMLETYRQEFSTALTAIADADGPVVFHCSGGKDRTGLIAALLLRLAGASIDDVAHDYSLSAEMWAREPRELEPRHAFMENTPAAAMRGTLEHLERKYGGVASYLRACGVDDARIAALRDRLRVSAA